MRCPLLKNRSPRTRSDASVDFSSFIAHISLQQKSIERGHTIAGLRSTVNLQRDAAAQDQVCAPCSHSMASPSHGYIPSRRKWTGSPWSYARKRSNLKCGERHQHCCRYVSSMDAKLGTQRFPAEKSLSIGNFKQLACFDSEAYSGSCLGIRDFFFAPRRRKPFAKLRGSIGRSLKLD